MAFKKILAIKLRSLGDTILMTAPLQELHKAYPHAQIDVAVLTPWAPLIENLPGVKKVWAYDRHHNPASRAKAAARLAYKLRREHYDCVVNFHASPSSAMIAFATGAKTRSIHFHGHKDRNRYSTVVVPGKGVLKPIIERDMDCVRALGLKIPEGAMPSVRPEVEEKKWANQLISVFGHGGPVLAMGIGASRPTKSWPIENFAKLAIEWCREKTGAAIALTAGSETALASAFLTAVDEVLSKTIPDVEESIEIRKRISCESKLSVRQLSAFLGAASVFVGNDSGPKHLAVANGTPSVSLFGPEDPYEWHPYPRARHPYFYLEGLKCRKDAQPGMPPWCGLDVCIKERHRCMQDLKVKPILEKCIEMAAQGPKA
jgi:ADP-heptose:LPS heptosyltransferase